MRKYWGIWLSLIILFVTVVLFSGCGKESVVATVNGEKINMSELNIRVDQAAARYGYDLDSEEGKEFVGYLREQILQSMIEEKVILQAAAEKDIAADKELVDKELEESKSQFDDQEEYEEYLKDLKLTEKDLRMYIEHSLILNELFDDITKDVTSTTKDIEQYYQDNQSEFFVPEQVHAYNIVVKTEEEAKEVIKRLDEGENFEELAVELSIDTTAQSNKGDIGYIKKEDALLEEFKEAAFELEVGQYTKEPIETMYGYHVIKVVDKKEEKHNSFEEVKANLENRFIFEEKNAVFLEYVDELKEKAEIIKHLPEEQSVQEQEGSEDGK